MADLLDRLHVDAGLGLLRAVSGLTVYPDAEGNVPALSARADRYVYVYPHIERPEEADGNALDGLSVRWVVRWYCHCIGTNAYSATAVAMLVDRALLNQRPAITGRAVGIIRMEAGNPANRDETTGTTVFDLLNVYKLETQPG